MSWSDVGVGAYIYEFADWGGVVVMARHPGRSMTPADEVGEGGTGPMQTSCLIGCETCPRCVLRKLQLAVVG